MKKLRWLKFWWVWTRANLSSYFTNWRVALVEIEKEEKIAQLRARILKVGKATVTHARQNPANEIIQLSDDWELDITNGTPAHRYDANGVYRFCGYTLREYVEIAKSPTEWVESERS